MMGRLGVSDSVDPQITVAMTNGLFSVAAAVVGAIAGFWRGGLKRQGADQRCERVCASMVSMGETMLAVMKALGVDDPRLAPHIAQMETRMAEARAYLNETKGV
jgi:hypothetical protein